MKTILAPIAVLMMFSSASFGQTLESVLIPIALEEPVPGAFNSLFKTEVWVVNTGTAAIKMAPQCQIVCEDIELSPGAARLNGAVVHYAREAGRPFARVHLVAGSPDNLTVTARVQDISRQAQTWGTELPVVRQTDLRSSLNLVDIPTDIRFRQTLRAYSFSPTQVRLRIFSLPTDAVSPGSVLVDEVTQLASTAASSVGYFQVLNLVDAYPQLLTAPRLRIEISSMSNERIWAFVSITNNETQHITTITPQK